MTTTNSNSNNRKMSNIPSLSECLNKSVKILLSNIVNISNTNNIINSSNKMDPLQDVALAYIEDVAHCIAQPVKESALYILLSLLKEQISFNNAIDQMKELIGTSEPAEKIIEIMKITDRPIPLISRKDFSKKNGRRKTHNWTNYEDQRLLAGLHKFGFENWTQIAEFVGNGRTRAQCSQRWNRGLDPSILKGPWTEEEERKLLDLMQIHGDRSWKTIAAQMDRRSDVQCRYHYSQIQKGRAVSKDYKISNSSDFSKSEECSEDDMTQSGVSEKAELISDNCNYEFFNNYTFKIEKQIQKEKNTDNSRTNDESFDEFDFFDRFIEESSDLFAFDPKNDTEKDSFFEFMYPTVSAPMNNHNIF